MASIINASTSGAGGVITTADASGQLELQTAGTTAVTIDASQNVGIGTVSPTNFGSNFKMFAVQGSDFGVVQAISANGATTLEMMGASGTGFVGTRTNHPLALRTNDTERMRIDSVGQNTMTTAIGYAQLRNVTGATIASSATIDFPNMSGILIVNNWTQGSVVIFSCGGGSVTTVNANGIYGGSVAYNAGINGYRWTSNSPSTSDYSFTLIATRPGG
jgi:hypothetical protein